MESINIKDVARICGVGVSTVSRAINNHPDINPETKNMILQVVKEHNYIPNNSARNLKRTDSKAIAVLIKGISNPFFSKMIRIFEKERLICECLKYEDKMDRERFKEGLMAYIKDPKKDIAKLMYYAKERKVVKKVQNMIGVWL